MNDRNSSIDLLKFLAALLITNSHLASQYGDYSFLAQGGYEGNFIFFFCSGYTLFLRPMGGVKLFKEWYVNRIIRIYPSLFAIAILSCLIWGNNENVVDIIIARKYWFVSAIMAQYIAIYVIGSYCRTKILWFILGTSLLGLILFLFWDHSISIWHGEYLSRYILSFNAMLLGAYVADCKTRIKVNMLLIDLGMVVISYIGINICAHLYQNGLIIFDYLRMLPLCMFVYFLYRVGLNACFRRVYMSKYLFPIIMFVGGLSLEIYLVQRYIIDDSLNSLFPLNILLLFIMIICVAFITRCIARVILQLFQDNPISLNKIVKPY